MTARTIDRGSEGLPTHSYPPSAMIGRKAGRRNDEEIRSARRRDLRARPRIRVRLGVRPDHRLLAGGLGRRLASRLLQGHEGRGGQARHRPEVLRRPGQGREPAEGGSFLHRPEGRRDHHRARRRHRLGCRPEGSQTGQDPGLPRRPRRRQRQGPVRHPHLRRLQPRGSSRRCLARPGDQGQVRHRRAAGPPSAPPRRSSARRASSRSPRTSPT